MGTKAEAGAIQNGVDFLIERQFADGAWRDFELEPGESDAWVTAYVGCCLAEVAASKTVSGFERTLDLAADWLRRAMRSDGGWGYNDACPVDCDSTALAVLFLNQVGEPAGELCVDRLLKFQKSDGGFAAFDRRDPANSWGISHNDVGPAALRALLTTMPADDPAIRRGLDHVLSGMNADGLWHSFWWTTPFYATLANLRLLDQTGTVFPRQRTLQTSEKLWTPSNAFAAALLGEILTVLKPNLPRAVEIGATLAASARPDGSWRASEPILRVVDPSCAEPWNCESTGPVVLDHRHLFTTATVLRFLVGVVGDYSLGSSTSGQR